MTTQRSIGRGAQVTSLGFGGAPIGNLYKTVSEDLALSAVDTAFDLGIRFFDTAPFYGHGLSEERIGQALSRRPRDAYVLATKVGRMVDRDKATTVARRGDDPFIVAAGRAVFDYSRDGVLRSHEASLRRLKVDRVDILFLHDVGRLTHGEHHAEILRMALDEALPTMALLRDSGAVGAIGIGVNEQEVVLEVLSRFPLDCVMLAGRYTLLEQCASAELMGYAHTHSLPVLVAGAFNSGLLGPADAPGATYNYLPANAAVLDAARSLYAECARETVDVGAAALQFPLAHPAVATVVAGLRTPAEVETAVNRVRSPVPGRLWKRLKEVGLLSADALVPDGG